MCSFDEHLGLTLCKEGGWITHDITSLISIKIGTGFDGLLLMYSPAWRQLMSPLSTTHQYYSPSVILPPWRNSCHIQTLSKSSFQILASPPIGPCGNKLWFVATHIGLFLVNDQCLGRAQLHRSKERKVEDCEHEMKF